MPGTNKLDEITLRCRGKVIQTCRAAAGLELPGWSGMANTRPSLSSCLHARCQACLLACLPCTFLGLGNPDLWIKAWWTAQERNLRRLGSKSPPWRTGSSQSARYGPDPTGRCGKLLLDEPVFQSQPLGRSLGSWSWGRCERDSDASCSSARLPPFLCPAVYQCLSVYHPPSGPCDALSLKSTGPDLITFLAISPGSIVDPPCPDL